jgi:hypothetical protein
VAGRGDDPSRPDALAVIAGFRGLDRRADPNDIPAGAPTKQFKIQGRWRRLIRETRDSRWMMIYGDHLREAGYAACKIGLTWKNVSDLETN